MTTMLTQRIPVLRAITHGELNMGWHNSMDMSKTEPESDDLDEYRDRVDAIIDRERDILDALAE